MPYFCIESVEKSSNEVMVAKNVACFRVLKQLEDGGSDWQFCKVYLINFVGFVYEEVLKIYGCYVRIFPEFLTPAVQVFLSLILKIDAFLS